MACPLRGRLMGTAFGGWLAHSSKGNLQQCPLRIRFAASENAEDVHNAETGQFPGHLPGVAVMEKTEPRVWLELAVVLHEVPLLVT